jgi:oligopeptide transport system ATP-binding protein
MVMEADLSEVRKKILIVKNLKKYFPVESGLLKRVVGHLKAVDDVSFFINKGEVLGLVGESGCGKTTTAECILRLQEPTSGEVLFNDINLVTLNQNKMREMRKDIQMIFQDPYSSLDPKMRVADIVGEPLDIFNLVKNKKERTDKIKQLLEDVGITAEQMFRYPYEFSGGQRQRIGIARSLAVNPSLIIADEPVSALDVSIQAQVLNLLNNLQSKYNLTYLFISHDLSVVKYISDRIGIMYLGKIVELNNKEDIYDNPMHPYTQSLLSIIPVPDPTYKKERHLLKGDVPSLLNVPSGCRFHPRCPKAKDICKEKEPELKNIGDGHYVSCHLD